MNQHLQRIDLRKPQTLGAAGLHDAYIGAVNAAIAAGHDDVAAELAATYDDEHAGIKKPMNRLRSFGRR